MQPENPLKGSRAASPASGPAKQESTLKGLASSLTCLRTPSKQGARQHTRAPDRSAVQRPRQGMGPAGFHRGRHQPAAQGGCPPPRELQGAGRSRLPTCPTGSRQVCPAHTPPWPCYSWWAHLAPTGDIPECLALVPKGALHFQASWTWHNQRHLLAGCHPQGTAQTSAWNTLPGFL